MMIYHDLFTTGSIINKMTYLLPKKYENVALRIMNDTDSLRLVHDAEDSVKSNVNFKNLDKEAIINFSYDFFDVEKYQEDTKKIDELIETKDYPGIYDFIISRNTPEYAKAVEFRDSLTEILNYYSNIIQKSRSHIQKKTYQNKIIKVSTLDKNTYDLLIKVGFKEINSPTINRFSGFNNQNNSSTIDSHHLIPTYVGLRELIQKYRFVHEHRLYLASKISEYRIPNAKGAEMYSKLRTEDEKNLGIYKEYTKSSINSLKAIGYYEPGTDEWLALRAKGIGGSDVGNITYADKKYGQQLHTNLLREKSGIPLIDEVEEEITYDSPIGRGIAWEDTIRYIYADNHPELNISFAKQTWGHNKYPHYHANFDGIFLDNKGKPKGILEIKTGSYTEKWGQPEEGIMGMPASYRMQILWYLGLAGLKQGTLVAILDDYDYREYNFNTDEPIVQQLMKKMFEEVEIFWNEVTKTKKEIEEKGYPDFSRQNGFGVSVNIGSIQEIYNKLYSPNGEDRLEFQKIKKLYTEKVSDSIKELPYYEDLDKKSFTQILNNKLFTKIFSTYPAKFDKPLIGVDIETNGIATRSSRIIEIGIARLHQEGKVQKLYSSLYGLPNIVEKSIGNGNPIHGITKEMNKNLPLFGELDAKIILNYLKSGIIVAHNVSFEDNFFIVNLPGYAEAKDNNEIELLDTRRLANWFMKNSNNSKLETFAKDNGIPYKGAHAALTDTIIMLRALDKFLKNIHENETHIITKAKRKDKQQAKIDVIIGESHR